jgi:hypothetical protein
MAQMVIPSSNPFSISSLIERMMCVPNESQEVVKKSYEYVQITLF